MDILIFKWDKAHKMPNIVPGMQSIPYKYKIILIINIKYNNNCYCKCSINVGHF